MQTELDLIVIRESLRRRLSKMEAPRPEKNWQYNEWVNLTQTILEIDRILDGWFSGESNSISPAGQGQS